MKTKCPKCNEITNLISIVEEQEIVVRGDPISVAVKILRCENCGEEFYDLNEESDPLALAYDEYRRKNSLILPHEIKELRSRYGFSQQELSRLLGWGGATISRYENGALQDLAHDKMLHLIQDPRNLLKLLKENPSVIPDSKREKFMKYLLEVDDDHRNQIKDFFDVILGDYEADQFSGYKKLTIGKILNAILFYSSGKGVLKTKLNKLLFYADFLHYKEYSSSITGSRYVHLTYGQILDNYEFYIASMIHEDNSLEIIETEIGSYLGDVLVSRVSPDIRNFEDSEIKVLAQVKEYFAGYSASEISSRSHNEKGYQETKDLELISYEYANAIEL